VSWPLVKLAEVAQVNPRLPKDVDETQQVIFLPMAAISEQGQILEQEKRILSETRKGFTYFEKNDVVVAKITPCFENGKAAFLDDLETQIGFGTTEFHVIRPDIEKLDGKYLFYLVWNKWFRHLGERNMSGSAGQKRVPTDFLKGLEIPLPPLDEQKRIAAILDKADVIRRKRQQAINLAEDFLRSVFLDMFGDPKVNPKSWVRCKLSDLINLITYGLTVRPEYIQEGLSLISAREIRTGDVLLDSAPKISQEDFDKLSDKAKPKINDILFSKTGSIGHCAIVSSDEKFAVTQNAARIVPNTDKVNPIFLLSLLRTKYFYDLSNREAKGNAVKDLQLGVMKEFEVYCPPLDKQEEYVQLRTAIIELTLKQQSSIDGSVNTFNSLSQKAFAGEL